MEALRPLACVLLVVRCRSTSCILLVILCCRIPSFTCMRTASVHLNTLVVGPSALQRTSF
jgi:hypothetical protein